MAFCVFVDHIGHWPVPVRVNLTVSLQCMQPYYDDKAKIDQMSRLYSGVHSPKANYAYSPFFTHSFLPSSSLPSLPSSLLSFEVGSLNPAKRFGELCMLSQRVRAEPGRQTIFSAFWAEQCSCESNFMGTFTKNMFVFSLFTSNITWGGTN